MLNIYLLRHGETQYNADGNRYCGKTDIALTEKGIRQANAVCKQLAGVKFDAVYSSPLTRARRTAEIASGGQQVITDERLIEASFGRWEGKTKEEFIPEDPQLWNDWMNDPANTRAGGEGETAQEIVDRADDFYRWALQKHKDQTILVVGHNGLNRFYLAYKLGMPLSNYRRIVQENSSVTFFQLDDDAVIGLQKLNCTL